MRNAGTVAYLFLAVCVAAAPQAAGPTVDEILDRYVAALGGRSALERITSRVTRGTFENETRGTTGASVVHAMAPDKRVLTGTGRLANGREFATSRGFNGAVAWSMNVTETGLRELQGAELEAEKREALFLPELRLREIYRELASRGTASVGDRKAHVVVGTTTAGEAETLYFDVESGLLVRRDSRLTLPRQSSSVGPGVIQVPRETNYDDDRAVDGVKVPFVVRTSTEQIRTVVRLQEVRHNAPIDPRVFERPQP
jgi:hypothetical protein